MKRKSTLTQSAMLLAGTVLLSGCLATAPKDSDPITALNPPQSDLALYRQYGVNTVGDFKAVALDMKETGYVSGGSSHREMFKYFKDREVAAKTPGLTATQVKQQRIDAQKRRVDAERAAQQQALDKLFNAKWSIGGLSCDLGGGTYTEFGTQYKVGMRSYIRGRLNETNQRASKRFTVNDGGSITLSYTVYASGNRLMTELLGSPNAVVARSKMTYKVQGDTLYGLGSIERLRSERLGKASHPGFETSRERTESTKCPT